MTGISDCFFNYELINHIQIELVHYAISIVLSGWLLFALVSMSWVFLSERRIRPFMPRTLSSPYSMLGFALHNHSDNIGDEM